MCNEHCVTVLVVYPKVLPSAAVDLFWTPNLNFNGDFQWRFSPASVISSEYWLLAMLPSNSNWWTHNFWVKCMTYVRLQLGALQNYTEWKDLQWTDSKCPMQLIIKVGRQHLYKFCTAHMFAEGELEKWPRFRDCDHDSNDLIRLELAFWMAARGQRFLKIF